MIATSRQLRQRAIVAVRCCLRLARRHYGSAISFAVIGAALVLALTGSSSSRTSSQSSASVARSTATNRIRLPAGFRQPLLPAQPRVTYYLYDDDEQYALLRAVVRSDSAYIERQGLPNNIGEVHFLRIVTDEEQSAAQTELAAASTSAQERGYQFDVVDLRTQN
jgi:hypothetical protein